MHQGTFRNRISSKLRELGVEAKHTDAYIRDMNKFYKDSNDKYKLPHVNQSYDFGNNG